MCDICTDLAALLESRKYSFKKSACSPYFTLIFIYFSLITETANDVNFIRGLIC